MTCTRFIELFPSHDAFLDYLKDRARWQSARHLAADRHARNLPEAVVGWVTNIVRIAKALDAQSGDLFAGLTPRKGSAS